MTLTSAKSKVINEIENILPEFIHFVPGHPIAGTEMSGPDAGFEDLFDNLANKNNNSIMSDEEQSKKNDLYKDFMKS